MSKANVNGVYRWVRKPQSSSAQTTTSKKTAAPKVNPILTKMFWPIDDNPSYGAIRGKALLTASEVQQPVFSSKGRYTIVLAYKAYTHGDVGSETYPVHKTITLNNPTVASLLRSIHLGVKHVVPTTLFKGLKRVNATTYKVKLTIRV